MPRWVQARLATPLRYVLHGLVPARGQSSSRAVSLSASSGGPTLHHLFGFNACGCRRPYDDVYLEPNQVDGEVGQRFRSTLRRSILDHDVLALDPPQLTQTLSKCLRRCELERDEARRTRMRGPFQPVAAQERAARPGGRR